WVPCYFRNSRISIVSFYVVVAYFLVVLVLLGANKVIVQRTVNFFSPMALSLDKNGLYCDNYDDVDALSDSA
ncbi:7776_t:CDS:2, partial [Acaulospora morrowiae]